MRDPDRPGAALIVVDVQRAFDDPAWGVRNNLAAESEVARLLTAWRSTRSPIVHIRHRNTQPEGRFHSEAIGFQPKDEARELPGEVVITKTVNSAFIGTSLEDALGTDGITDLVVCGLTTDHCVSTTVRMAANLGFRVVLASDASATFERTGPDGRHWTAEAMHDSAIASLHGEFAEVLPTGSILASILEC